MLLLMVLLMLLLLLLLVVVVVVVVVTARAYGRVRRRVGGGERRQAEWGGKEWRRDGGVSEELGGVPCLCVYVLSTCVSVWVRVWVLEAKARQKVNASSQAPTSRFLLLHHDDGASPSVFSQCTLTPLPTQPKLQSAPHVHLLVLEAWPGFQAGRNLTALNVRLHPQRTAAVESVFISPLHAQAGTHTYTLRARHDDHGAAPLHHRRSSVGPPRTVLW